MIKETLRFIFGLYVKHNFELLMHFSLLVEAIDMGEISKAVQKLRFVRRINPTHIIIKLENQLYRNDITN